MNKIDIIYQTSSGPQTDFEFEYIENVIFKNIKHENHFNVNKYDINKKNPLVIYSCDRMKPDIDLLNYLNVIKEYSLLHLSNEYQQHLEPISIGGKFMNLPSYINA
ncbi:hypothetical protein REJ26_002106 [Providencia stuartii]|uniref:hypothetical protein n=1 Tax=Providencia sp. 2023EL-00965 TaxID=3084975 RepID=UPI0027F54B54|nr:hypothetical protein [Providencia sp. 2023EL-00965]ELR5300332.1 hypothetical protein [Providencia stuartii]MDW7589574.1 hypothetical protein [Providencia sp. 2023EL-00965]